MALSDHVRRLWFASRKMRLPIPHDGLVLEVGSGDSPSPRSDVLFELTLESFERAGAKTVVDRPLVLGNVERLPFRDKAFDYVIAFHVLEHMERPECFFSELERVARAGYLETPSFWSERINPLCMHRLEVGIEPFNGSSRLVVRKKPAPDSDPELTRQFHVSFIAGMGFDRLHPDVWVTRYSWQDHINYRVLNPDEMIDWPPAAELPQTWGNDPRSLSRRVLKSLSKYTHRPKQVSLPALLRCPDCTALPLEQTPNSLRCNKCGREYPIMEGIPYMHPSGA